jgi:DNA topoisomerase-2
MNEIQTTNFFNSEYVNYASYDNIRKIASVIDGQKNAARKVLWFILQKNIKNEVKVSQLDSKVAESEEYLHGSMAGVIVNLAQDYKGTNNINLLMPEGNFGTELIPEASAPRYIYTYGSKDFFELFNKEDNPILRHQNFEGHDIEPVFFVPNLPILLVNGANGISSGFAQKILPRNPDEIKKYINYYLTKNQRKPFNNKPWYKGFTGEIKQGESKNQWIIYGDFKRVQNKVYVTELPIGYDLKSYIKVLDKLEEQKKIIQYKDNSNDSFNFEIQFNRKYLNDLTDEQVFELLKLRKKVTENYTVMSEDNKILQLNSANEIMQRYIKVKLDYTQKRKEHKLKTIKEDIKVDISKYLFIKSVIDSELILTHRKTEDIIKDLEKNPKILKKDNYGYLLNLPIRSLTQEQMDKLLKSIKTQKQELDDLQNKTATRIWLDEII